jgi:hypothetical protein
VVDQPVPQYLADLVATHGPPHERKRYRTSPPFVTSCLQPSRPGELMRSPSSLTVTEPTTSGTDAGRNQIV